MKKVKRRALHKRKTVPAKRGKKFKGVIDAGTIYGVLLLAIILGGAYMMLGNIAPNITSPNENQQVYTKNPGDNSTHSNLQLKDFGAITLTPSPTPTATPTPTPTKPPINPGGSPGSCFVAGTKVLLADKSQKNIEDVKPGDMVMGYDGKNMVKEEVEQVEAPVRDHHDDLRLQDGTVLGFTDDHPIYTQNGWEAINPEQAKYESPGLPVSQLKIGDKVLKSNGQYIAIVSWKHIPGRTQTYNLKRVSSHNTYYANGILVHNKGSGSNGGSAG